MSRDRDPQRNWIVHRDEIDVALLALDALNRRAKHPGVDVVEWSDRMEQVYALKNRFLESLVAARRATVARFRVRRLSEEPQVWYLVTSGDYSFHVPWEDAGPEVRMAAVEVPPHEPFQEPRAIPETGLTVEEQVAAVERAIEWLRARGPSG